MESRDPFSIRALIAALLVAVVGGVIVAIIAGEGRFATSLPSSSSVAEQESVPEDSERCLGTPTLIRPKDGSRLATLNPVLQWQQSALIGSRIELSTHADFSDVGTHWGLKPGLDGFQELRLNSNLEPNTLYYWRVTFLCGDWDSPEAKKGGSSTASFISGSGGAILPMPVPIAPTEGSVIGGKAVFRWSAVAGAKGYLLSSGTSGFFYPEFTNGIDTNYEVDFSSISGHYSYNWSVAAYNDYAVGPFSTPISYAAGGHSEF
jgi:hypothetical protein